MARIARDRDVLLYELATRTTDSAIPISCKPKPFGMLVKLDAIGRDPFEKRLNVRARRAIVHDCNLHPLGS